MASRHRLRWIRIMSFFKVGCNFSKDLYEQASHLNKEVSINRIEEFYGSRKESAWLSLDCRMLRETSLQDT